MAHLDAIQWRSGTLGETWPARVPVHAYSDAAGETRCGIVPAESPLALVDLDNLPAAFQRGGVDEVDRVLGQITCDACADTMEARS